MDAQLQPDHDPARSAKRKMVIVQKKKSTRFNGVSGWAPGLLISISCTTSPAKASFFLLYNPRPPMSGLASLKRNTVPVKNVNNGLNHDRVFICKWLCILTKVESHNIFWGCLDSHLKNTSSISPYLQLQLSSCVVSAVPQLYDKKHLAYQSEGAGVKSVFLFVFTLVLSKLSQNSI